MRSAGRQISSIQALRALAACAVAVAHTHTESETLALITGKPNPLPSLVTGAAGVDLFFVISGFVMVYSSWRLFGAPGATVTFVLRRLIRIVPLYWLGTTFFVLVAIWTAKWRLADVDWPLVLASYFFVPTYRPDSAWNPIMPIGWTLNYEMFFYALFALALPFARRVAVIGLSCTLVLLATYGGDWDFAPDAIRYFSNAYLLEFGGGALIGLAYCEGVRLPKSAAWGLGLTGLAFIAMTAIWDITPTMFSRQVAWGIPAALMVIASLHVPEREGAARHFLSLLGDASYAIYILHPIVMMILRIGALKTSPSILAWVWNWPWLHMGVLATIAIGASVAFHVIIERPFTDMLRSKLATRRGSVLQPA